MRAILTTCFLAIISIPTLAQTANAPVPMLDLQRYSGQWHEIAHLPMFWQRQCRGDITATYTLQPGGTVGVRNACRTEDGSMDVSEGVARPVAGKPGALEVRFAPDWLSWLPWTWADYWVIDLDPDYRWAVVGSPSREYLWILSRTPSMEQTQFDRLKTKAEAKGYDLRELKVMTKLAGSSAASTN